MILWFSMMVGLTTLNRMDFFQTIKQQPLPSVCVLLFVAIIAFFLSGSALPYKSSISTVSQARRLRAACFMAYVSLCFGITSALFYSLIVPLVVMSQGDEVSVREYGSGLSRAPLYYGGALIAFLFMTVGVLLVIVNLPRVIGFITISFSSKRSILTEHNTGRLNVVLELKGLERLYALAELYPEATPEGKHYILNLILLIGHIYKEDKSRSEKLVESLQGHI